MVHGHLKFKHGCSRHAGGPSCRQPRPQGPQGRGPFAWVLVLAEAACWAWPGGSPWEGGRQGKQVGSTWERRRALRGASGVDGESHNLHSQGHFHSQRKFLQIPRTGPQISFQYGLCFSNCGLRRGVGAP